MRSLAAAPCLLLCVCLWAAVPSPARADQRELILSLDPAFSLVHVSDQTVYGGGTGLDVSYGITDAVALRATGAVMAHPIDAAGSRPAGTLTAWHAGLGITYTIDILRLVPYFDLSIGLLGTRRPAPGGGADTHNDLGVEVGVGLDYILTRRVAVGVVLRYHAFLTSLSTIPVWLYIGPRVAVHFEL